MDLAAALIFAAVCVHAAWRTIGVLCVLVARVLLLLVQHAAAPLVHAAGVYMHFFVRHVEAA